MSDNKEPSGKSPKKPLGNVDPEADALIDSLFADVEHPALEPEPPPAPPDPAAPKTLHQPAERVYSPDEVTLHGRPAEPNPLEELPASNLWELDEPASSSGQAIDALLAESKAPPAHSTTPAPEVIAPPAAPQAAKPGALAAPKPATFPRPVGNVPRPAGSVAKLGATPSRVAKPLTDAAPVISAAPKAPPPAPEATPSLAIPDLAEEESTQFFMRSDLEAQSNSPPPEALDEERTHLLSRSAIADLIAGPSQPAPADSEPPPDAAIEEDTTSFYERGSLADELEPETLSGRPSQSSVDSLQLLAADEFEELGERVSQPSEAPPTRSAFEQLSQGRLLEQWVSRAEWMESEARSAADPRSKARALLVASELWAMAGQLKRARDVASVAAAIAPSMAISTRQLRWLAAADGRDFKTVAASLETELRAAGTPEARAHAALLSADIHRLMFRDDAAAQKKLDAAVRAAPADPRAHLTRVARQLATDKAAASGRWPEEQGYEPLAAALRQIARRRGASESAGETSSVDLRFEQARRALATGDRKLAGELITTFAEVPELERGALWLAAALYAPLADTRGRSVELLRRLVDIEQGVAVRRALAARALEQGDQAAVQAALSQSVAAAPAMEGSEGAEMVSEPALDAFSAADRVALAALTGLDLETMSPWLLALRKTEDSRSVADAVRAGLGGAPDVETCAPSLGRALARQQAAAPSEELREAIARYRAEFPAEAVSAVLELELSRHDRSAERVAAALTELARTEGDEASSDESSQRQLAIALCLELAGNTESAKERYAALLKLDPSSEAATRALLADAPGNGAAALLESLAEASPDRGHSALLLIEAALRRGTDEPETFEALLGRALEAAPALPFAYRLGEQLARSRGDAPRLLEWLRRRRELAEDPLERALDLVREALLVADEDISLAAELLEQARALRTTDVALSELHERLATAADTSRGVWREGLASELEEPKLAQALLLAAAFEYDRAGDASSAERVASRAADLGDSEYASVVAERLAGVAAAPKLAERLLDQARAEQDRDRQRELYERLAELDEGRGEQASSVLWQSAILERTPGYLPALRRLEQSFMGSLRETDLGGVAASLAELLAPGDAAAHAWLASKLLAEGPDPERLAKLVMLASRLEPTPLWALRDAYEVSRKQRDDAELLRTAQQLAERARRYNDIATLSLRAAEAALRLDRLDEAANLLERALELIPEHRIVLERRAELFARRGETHAEAETYEALARISKVTRHALDAWARAANAWLDRVGDAERGIAALERAAEIDIGHGDVFARLQTQYVANNQRTKLAELLQKKLERVTAPEERVRLEVTRGRALAEMGDRDAARKALTAALDASPEHVEALDALAELCLLEGDWTGAEQAWIRLARHVSEGNAQADVYEKLARLYDSELPNPSRAELSYREVLKRRPGDVATSEKLVLVLGRLGQKDKALELQNELVQQAVSVEDKRDRTLALARVYEDVLSDRRQAEATLDKARKAWPQDAEVLRAVVQFYQRAGEDRTVAVVLDRSAGEARRALGTGRFEPAFFRTLATVAEIRGEQDSARVGRATLAALQGSPSELEGIGSRAAEPRFDELCAPDLLSLPLRALLRRTGHVLDGAFPSDLRALRAQPLPTSAGSIVAGIQSTGAALGLPSVETLVSPTLGFGCLAARSVPPLIVVGQALVDSTDESVRRFMLLRTLKIVQAHASAPARAVAVELWPMLAAYLGLFVPNWQPQGVDAKKLAEGQERLKAGLPRDLDPDTPVLALEVIGSLGNRASQLGTAVQQWGNRCALLALGDLAAAFRALALIGSQGKPPPQGADLLKWVARHAEARDLAIFSVSEQYAEARRQANASDA